MTTVSRGITWAHRLLEAPLRRLFAVMLLITAGLMIRQGLIGWLEAHRRHDAFIAATDWAAESF